jgi:hypothetical protein
MNQQELKQLTTALLDFQFERSYAQEIVPFVYILGIGLNALTAFLIFLQGVTFGGILGGLISLVVGALSFIVGMAALRLLMEMTLAFFQLRDHLTRK